MENLGDVTQALMQTWPCPAVGSLSRMANGTDTKVRCHLDSRSWTDHGKALLLPKTGSGGDAGPGELDLILRSVTNRPSGEESEFLGPWLSSLQKGASSLASLCTNLSKGELRSWAICTATQKEKEASM